MKNSSKALMREFLEDKISWKDTFVHKWFVRNSYLWQYIRSNVIQIINKLWIKTHSNVLCSPKNKHDCIWSALKVGHTWWPTWPTNQFGCDPHDGSYIFYSRRTSAVGVSEQCSAMPLIHWCLTRSHTIKFMCRSHLNNVFVEKTCEKVTWMTQIVQIIQHTSKADGNANLHQP